jgi:hypothetical protein
MTLTGHRQRCKVCRGPSTIQDHASTGESHVVPCSAACCGTVRRRWPTGGGPCVPIFLNDLPCHPTGSCPLLMFKFTSQLAHGRIRPNDLRHHTLLFTLCVFLFFSEHLFLTKAPVVFDLKEKTKPALGSHQRPTAITSTTHRPPHPHPTRTPTRHTPPPHTHSLVSRPNIK